MPTIYNVKVSDNETLQLVDKDYIDQQVDMLKNIIMNSDKSKESIYNMKIDIDSKDLDLVREKINASNIEQDASHRMLSDSQIQAFKNKPTISEVDEHLNKVSEELKIFIEKLFTNVLNLPDALKNLQNTAELFANSPLNNTEVIKSFIVSIAEFKSKLLEHLESANDHVSNVERKAMNLCIDLVNNGMLDKIMEGRVSYANEADNALKLNGVSLDNLRGRHLEEIIYGVEPYSKEKVDVLFKRNSILDNDFNSTYSMSGIIGFKPGSYNYFEDFDIKSDANEIIINGSGNSTIIKFNKMHTGNSIVNNCTLSRANNESILYVDSNSTFNGCNFNNIAINILPNSSNIKFINCNFSHCHKISTDHVSNLIITLCSYDANTVLPVSMGRQDYIINNNYCSF